MAESIKPTRSQNKTEEESASGDSAINQNETQTNQPIAFSEKAIHQRDADENLFLRFLELDPPSDGNSPAPTSSQAPNDANARRMSVFKPQLGRTPFTITKRLNRNTEKGFGFSIVWTHPPRVEKVEPGLSASQNNILPGDYVIFVDKHNVVTMPEPDVLNLIRSQGNQLTLEIFRRPPTSASLNASLQQKAPIISELANGVHKLRNISVASSEERSISPTALRHPVSLGLTTTRYSNASIETAKKKMQLPQVTFSKESIVQTTDLRKRFLAQLISREQNFVAALQFGMQRFVQPLAERKDLISPNDNKTLFQNIDELMRISEDILEQLVNNGHGEYPQLNFVSRVYLSKTTAICAAYKKYCNGIKRADCVLVNKSRQPNSEFVTFITEPQVRRRRLDLTMLIHRPLQHFREILKLMQLLASHCHIDSEEYKNFTNVINELQSAYREITVGGGLMEPLGEGRPLLTLQDLEARMVFTRCKPFTLAVQGRQWIFGGDLSRVEGRSVKPYWTLLFSDILIFAKVSRDRVLFITEEPLPIGNIVDSCFTIRKKTSEFRLTIDPNGRFAESPTAYCGPDLTRTPKKNTRRKVLILRAPSMELKAVWQNLLQRQIFLVNAALGSTPLSSPLESPDVLNTLVSLSDLGATNTSMASVKLTSIDSLNKRNQQQVRLKGLTSSFNNSTTTVDTQLIGESYENLEKLASTYLLNNLQKQKHQQFISKSQILRHCKNDTQTNTNTGVNTLPSILTKNPNNSSNPKLKQISINESLHLFNKLSNIQMNPTPWQLNLNSSNDSNYSYNLIDSEFVGSVGKTTNRQSSQGNSSKSLAAIPETITEFPEILSKFNSKSSGSQTLDSNEYTTYGQWKAAKSIAHMRSLAIMNSTGTQKQRPFLEFSLSSVGRSFIDEIDELEENFSGNPSVHTPETPTPNISPSSPNPCISETFSNDFVSHHAPDSPGNLHVKNKTNRKMLHKCEAHQIANFGSSWDLLELDLEFHQVNLDSCYDTDVEECMFLDDVSGEIDDPFGVLPTRPTSADSLDL